MITLTKKQIKILILGSIAAFTFAIFIYFIYVPATKKLAKLKHDYASTQAELADLKKMIGEDKPLEQAILYLREKLKTYERKFPEKDEDVLRLLSAQAEKGGVDILSMTPGKKRPIKDVGGVSISVKDYTVEEMQISLNVKAQYKKLGEFLKTLKEDIPIFIRVGDVTMSSSGDKTNETLSISLSLTAYLLVPGIVQE